MSTTSVNYGTKKVSLVWLNIDADDIYVQQALHSFIDHILMFQNPDECETSMRLFEQDQIILVVSGSVAEVFVPRVHDLKQLLIIYIYSLDKKKFEPWSRTYKKVTFNRTAACIFMSILRYNISCKKWMI